MRFQVPVFVYGNSSNHSNSGNSDDRYCFASILILRLRSQRCLRSLTLRRRPGFLDRRIHYAPKLQSLILLNTDLIQPCISPQFDLIWKSSGHRTNWLPSHSYSLTEYPSGKLNFKSIEAGIKSHWLLFLVPIIVPRIFFCRSYCLLRQ